MTFDELVELRTRGPAELTDNQSELLLEEAWRLRIVISVLEATLNLWHALKGKGETADGILLRQHEAAIAALESLDK